ncbi:nap family protein [Pyrenophora tritici-repentis]|nr:nap family protein [Pyrenophora tritici-repentis]KAI0579471.1 nap family protein [Pyrenophora tritici-repentis]
MDEQMPEEVVVRFEELGALEHEFEEAELEIIRKAEALQSPLYKKRADFVANIPHFWSLVFEQAPPEIDNFIQPTDSKVFAECLETFEVSRFELDEPNGSPRSFSLKLGFSDNEYFEDKVLEKKFWFRKTKDWQGLVSEPVKINWKKGKDLTGGLTDAAYKLGELRKKLGADTASGAARKEEAKSKEYKKLAQLIETATDASVSFFGLFSFVSGYRWVSAEESAQVTKEEKESWCFPAKAAPTASRSIAPPITGVPGFSIPVAARDIDHPDSSANLQADDDDDPSDEESCMRSSTVAKLGATLALVN